MKSLMEEEKAESFINQFTDMATAIPPKGRSWSQWRQEREAKKRKRRKVF